MRIRKWYSKTQIITSAISLVMVLLALIALVSFITTAIGGCEQKYSHLQTRAEAQAESIISWSTVSTETIGSEGNHLVSDFWYDSGAQSAGFNLDAYVLAVEMLNPGVSLSPLRDGWELRFPMNVK